MSDEWTTVTSKKSGYVPPHLRTKAAVEAAEAEKKKPIDIKNMVMFPTLGGSKAAKPPTTSVSEDSSMSFKQKIDELIAYEARTEQEKEAAEEARRALEGFARISLKITPEFIKKYNDTLTAAIEREITQETTGCMPYWVDSPYTVINDEYETDDE